MPRTAVAALAISVLGLATGVSAAPLDTPSAKLLTRPGGLTAGAAWTAEAALSERGRPLVVRNVRFWILRLTTQRSFPASSTKRKGTYRARISFPSAGTWRLGVAFGRVRLQLARVNVRPRALTLQEPFGTAAEPDGGLLIADRAANRVLRRSPSGKLTVVAGTGSKGLGRDGPATAVPVQEPLDVARDEAGNLYVASENRVLKIDAAGRLQRIAGTGARGTSGDGGPARDARINGLGSVAVDAPANVFATEYENRIRRVDATTSFISTVAGTGAEGYSGDGGPARAARIFHPHGVDVGPDGSVYIADTENNRVRRIDPQSGEITTVAGTGERGLSGDGGPAKAAMLSIPVHVVAGEDGSLYIADLGNSRVRRVDPAGRISSLAARFDQPIYVELDGRGGLWVSELEVKRLRRLDLATGALSPAVR